MSNPPKRPRVESQAHLTSVHLPKVDAPVPYENQLVTQIERLFAENPDQDAQLIGIDILSFSVRTDERKLITMLSQRGYTYQVVRFAGKTGQDTGVLIKRIPDFKKPAAPAPAETPAE